MLYIKYIKNTFLLILIAFFLHACENTDDKQTLKQIAITLISNYADGKGTTPTIRNYEDAGIIGVNERNLNELNLFIRTLVAEDIDTEKELNDVIDALGVSLSSDIFGPVITLHGANPLTIEQGSTYTDPGVTAIDGRDGEVTVYCAGEVDTRRVGTYIIKHSAVDEAGNLVTVERVVYVVEISNPPPPPPPTTLFSIGGNATGLAGTVILQNNNVDNLSVTADGSFLFSAQVADMSTYNISILSVPSGQTCTLTNNTGTIAGTNISNITLACSTIPISTYTIGGTINGARELSVTFLNTINGESVSVSPNATTFQFPTAITNGSTYNIIYSPFNGLDVCPSATNTTGTIAGTNITNINFVCFVGGP